MAAATSTGAAAAAALAAPAPYYFEDGLRRVAPYFYTYKTWVKERWRGRQLIDVFASEFRDRPLEYYRAALESGKVLVNGKQVGPHHVLKNGELVAHTTHRHEPPVPSDPIDVIHEDEDMMVINKPAGIPVHPAGRYSCNSVVEILKAERGPSFAALPCNRLDRLTSGIMFVAKNAKAAEGLRMQLVQRTVRKEYVARVQGRFPDGDVACDQPILLISPKLGLNRVRASGKPAKTLFRRLAYYPPSPRPSAVTNGDPDAANAARPVLGGLQRDHASGDKGYSIRAHGATRVLCLPGPFLPKGRLEDRHQEYA
ncbi:hypothetical protein P8C59_002930 [Phyllachora maydis]|uniref:Pseudouridine synthase n=1 Tax=Phyllachora maydis TaxID=1825666 RepID=A0AAD9M9T1_9PEZI|nr:hypothetical protein P8C59_002930 [Phyllachora maydis]